MSDGPAGLGGALRRGVVEDGGDEGVDGRFVGGESDDRVRLSSSGRSVPSWVTASLGLGSSLDTT
jgi:hypothetical protein